MDSELTARISPTHQRRLAWFEDHAGEVSPPPAPLEDGLFLVSTPKGIFKPGDIPYALSVKIKLDSPYPDGLVLPRSDGGWRLAYHQENPDLAARDQSFTNRGLMRCIADRIPVGVLCERERIGRRRQYEVLGLAMPVRWHEGYFFLESLAPGGVPAGDTVGAVLEATAVADVEHEAEQTPLPTDEYDARLRVYRQIFERRGQAAFRAKLLEAYSGRCAITRCDAAAALEAAHLRPYRGPEFNTVDNGLLLRGDIHTLLDLQLLAFEPLARKVVLSRELTGTHYESLSGVRLADPVAAALRPRRESLEHVWQQFMVTEAAKLLPNAATDQTNPVMPR